MKKFFTNLAIILLLVASQVVFSQTNTWDGSASVSWTEPLNWSLGHVPNSGENVVIPSVPVNQPTLSGAPGSCNILTVNSGATLTISATSANNALLTASGSATINGALSIGGTILKTAKLVVVNITWASGSSMAGFYNGSLEVSGNWEFATGSAASMGYSRVVFTGSTNTEIISKSTNSSFSGVTIGKNNGNTVSIASTSTATLNFTETVTINAGSMLIGQANITTIFGASLYNSGHFSFNSGTASFEKSSGTQVIQVNSGDVFNNLTINGGATITINNYLQVLNDVTIQFGVFDPQGNIVVLFGDWTNAVGPAGFVEGTGRVVFSGGNYHQYCSTETFNILEVHKAIGGAFRVNGTNVTCAQYEWTAGSVDVLNSGTFTALDLADNAILGGLYVNPGSTINLHQDASQFIDLGADLVFTGGGAINVFGGNRSSFWAYGDDASISMTGGTLDFVDQGISLFNTAPYTLATNITGGTIRTSKGFFSNRADFNPPGGTIELYGGTNANLEVTAGSLWNLKISKNIASIATLASNIAINGIMTVDNGNFIADNKIITLANNLTISSDGIFTLGANSQLKMANGKYIYVNNGGTLKTVGAPSDMASITHSAGYYFLLVQANGTVSARHTSFLYMNTINFQSGSIIDPANAFYRCTFMNSSPAYQSMLIIGNEQDVSIHEANFPTLNGAYTVYKPNNAGHVYFKDATGVYAGPAHENDPFNRVDWVASTPGLWTGAASSDWFTADNWDDFAVPTNVTNVTIPGGTINSPVINTGNAICKDVVIQSGGVLAQNNGAYLHVYGSLNSENGQYLMNGTSYLYFRGSGNAIWKVANSNDTYSNVDILKDWSGYMVELQGQVTCTGTVEVCEGILWFDYNSSINVTNTGTGAFEVEDGGGLHIGSGSWIDVAGNIHFFGGSNTTVSQSVYCGKDFVVDASATVDFLAPNGFLIMTDPGTSYLDISPTCDLSLYNLQILKTGGICYLKSGDLTINNYIAISTGVFSCNNGPSPTAAYDIYVKEGWHNGIGPAGFEESSGRVIFTGPGPLHCSTETFNILEMNKASDTLYVEGNVTCAAYDWTAGCVSVGSGHLFNANDLSDNAIKGSFICRQGGTINLTNSGTGTMVDLSGELHNFGGEINITGSVSYWPYNGNATVEMTGGVIDFKTCGVTIYNSLLYSLAENITGGTIRTSGGFAVQRADFTPGGGAIEFYGPTDGGFYTQNGGYVHDVVINKAPADNVGGFVNTRLPGRDGSEITDAPLANTINVTGTANIKGNVIIVAGVLAAGANTINVGENWTNNVGSSGFSEGTGTVVFNGTNQSNLQTTESFYNLNVDSPGLYTDDVMNIANDLHILEGNLYLSTWSSLNLTGNLTIDLNAGLTQGYWGGHIHIGRNWTNHNITHGSGIGFNPGSNTSVIFNGNTDQILTTASPYETFTNLGIDKSGGSFRPNQSILVTENAVIENGAWEDNVSSTLHHKFYGDFIVEPTGAFFSAFALNTVEFAGDASTYLEYKSSTGCFHDLLINKGAGCQVIQWGQVNCLFGGNLTIENGSYYSSGFDLWVEGDVTVNDAGSLRLLAPTQLVLSNSKNLNVNTGGRLQFYGGIASIATIRADVPTARYAFNINSGGTVAAEYTIFKNMNANGVNVKSGATIDPLFPFKGCTFQDGAAAGTLLTINNNQTLTIRNAVFPANAWAGTSNVTKALNQGLVNFVDFSGGFSGELYDADNFERINWVPTLVANATATPGTICAGSTSQLHANPSGGVLPYSYVWSPAGSLSDPSGASPVASPASTTQYAVTVTDALGSTATSNVTVTVNPLIPVSVTISASENPVAPGTTVVYVASPVNAGASPVYQWKVNGVAVGTNAANYSYVPVNGDQVSCVLNSSVTPCASGNPAISNVIPMAVLPAMVAVTGMVSSGMINCYNAFNIITVAGSGSNFLVESGGRATLIAGMKISFLPGTTVQSGGYLHGSITTSNTYCGSLPPAMVAVVSGQPEQPGPFLSPVFGIFPNPTTGKFTLVQKSKQVEGTIKVQILGMRGESLLSETLFNEQKHEFDISGLSAGLYFVKIMKDNHVETLKLVLTR